MKSVINTLIAQYLDGIQLLRKSVAHLTAGQVLAHPIQGKWSVLEVVCHLSDFESVFADRMKRIIALENPLLLGADENLFLKLLSYQQRKLEEELALMDLVRSQMARILGELPPSVWGKIGNHSEKGAISLKAVVEKAVFHINHHIPFIEEKKLVLI